MPIYHFLCTKCATPFKKLLSPDQFSEQKNKMLCVNCGYCAHHVPGAATSQTMEVLDDGIAPRRVERLSEAERIFKEREVAHDLKYGSGESDDGET